MLTHQNSLVQDFLVRADKTLKNAVQKLGRGDLETAAHLARVTFLQLNFCKQLVVAEVLESEVGESEFLALTETDNSRESAIGEAFARADKIVRDFVTQCKTAQSSIQEQK